MKERNFMDLLKRSSRHSTVCVGLDSHFSQIPDHIRQLPPRGVAKTIMSFNNRIVDFTHDLVCAYKLNSAFYEMHGSEGIEALKMTIEYIKQTAPDLPIILDAKRADIDNTNNGYALAAFNELGADAITVHPYLGGKALAPFLDRSDKGVIVLCRTSNAGAGEFQDLEVNGRPFYQIVAERVAKVWNVNGNCAVVVGATYPEELRTVREIVGDMPILIPGIGAQGGDVEKTVLAGQDSRGRGMIINASRSIIFASNGRDFAQAARQETGRLRALVNQYSKKKVKI